jgi:hypothetical protein
MCDTRKLSKKLILTKLEFLFSLKSGCATQTGTTRNKYHYCTTESLEPLKKQPLPITKPSSANFCQNF